MVIKIGVVGTGWWACFNHIPTIQADRRSDVVAIADLSTERLDNVGDRFGIAGRYTDFREMLARESLDGVVVATPHVAHTEVALAALRSGCHVLVEKPMTTASKDAYLLQAATRQAGKQVLVPCGWNFKTYTARAADMIREGRIGEIKHIVCQMASPLGDLMAGAPMTDTAGHVYRPNASTWADPKRSGGYGWGQMSHSLAWIYHVTGLEADEAFCMAVKSPSGVDYFDAATLRMSNGATMSLSGASTVPKHCAYQIDVRIFGTEGVLLFDIERERLEVRRDDRKDDVYPIAAGYGSYDGTLPVTHFISICSGDETGNPCDVNNGVNVVTTLDALYRSADSGKLEKVETKP